MKFLNKFLDFLGNSYDKIILGLLLCFLSVTLVFQTKNLSETREKVQSAGKGWNKSKKIISPVDKSNFAINTQVEKDRIWKPSFGEGSLFDPGKFVYAMDGEPYILHLSTIKNPFTGNPDLPKGVEEGFDEQESQDTGKDVDRDGIPDKIEEKYQLNRHDPKDAFNDKDYDGFSNLEEYNLKTALNDPSSHPYLVHRLRFLKRVRSALDVSLKKVMTNNEPENKKNWDIMIKYKSQNRWKTDFLKIGDLIPQYGHKIIDAEYKEIIRNKIPVEQSEITIQKDNDDPITLERNRPTYTGDDLFELIFLFNNRAIRITTVLNRNFSIENLNGKEEIYRIIEYTGQELVAELESTREKFTIIKYSPKDKDRFIRE